MSKGGSVSFTYEWEPEDGIGDPLQLEVECNITDYYPAVMYLRNGDPGYPAEGGEVEDITVTLPDGSTMDVVPDDLFERLSEAAHQELEDTR